jgi:hypothetical protein
MANWEYKVISSGKHGMATMAALEQHLNELGQQQWEIIDWHTAPDNPLLFTGLARRPILRDWAPEEMPAAQEAARAEKTEEVKERDAWRDTLKEELAFITDTEEDEGDAEADTEDMFDVLRPLMKRSQRGPGSVGSISFLARKLEQDENDLLGALAEAGLPLVEDPQAVPPSLKHEDEFFWLNKNARGEIWLNSGPRAPAAKPVQEPREQREPRPERAAEPRAERQPSQRQPDPRGERQPRQPQQRQPQAPRDAAPAGENAAPVAPDEARDTTSDSAPAAEGRFQPQPREATSNGAPVPLPEGEALLLKLRPMMRRNRRGRGWSGSTSYLSRALRQQEADLMAAFAKLGLTLADDPQAKPVFVEINGMLYWLNRGQGGQIWINAREQRPGEAHSTGEDDDRESAQSGAPAAVASVEATSPARAAESAPVAETVPAATPAVARQPEPEPREKTPVAPAPTASDDTSIFARIRPHFTKNKRSASFSAAPGALAEVLAVSQADLVEELVKAGLSVPENEEAKPVFAEHAGEIFWFNRNAKDELWLNAKAKPARKPAGASRSGGASRSRKSAE